jgi:hypothetical protein
MHFSINQELTQTPTFPDELWDKCRKDKDFMPFLFEWYKYIGGLCAILASISRNSPANREITPLNYGILIGLLNRCARLMLSNMRLAVTNKYGETIMLLDRSIYESLVTIQWLCTKNSDERFRNYLADGIKSDLKLKVHIHKSIAERGGKVLVIENQMLSSIQTCINSTGLSEEQILKQKKLPDFLSMCIDVGLSEKFYIGTQRMGSHAVHGSWTSLTSHYLRLDESGEYRVRDHNVPPHENQFMVIPIIVLDTLKKFIVYIVPSDSDRGSLESILDNAISEMGKLAREITSRDFEVDSD